MNIIFSAKKIFSSMCDAIYPVNMRIRGRYVLALHRVIPLCLAKEQYVQDCMYITPETFVDLIKWMAAVGDIVSLNKILDFKLPNERPMFAITFDDGWQDNYEYAFPILKKYNLDATVFLTTDAINTGIIFWPEEVIAKIYYAVESNNYHPVYSYLAKKTRKKGSINKVADAYLEMLKMVDDNKRKKEIEVFCKKFGVENRPIISSILNWDQIREMSEFGISFGSHTHTHSILQYCDSLKASQELKKSKEIIEREIGREVDVFSYPNARYTEKNAKIVARYYRFAFRIHNLPLQENDSHYFLPRILVNEKICEKLSYLKFRLLGVPNF